ncbi:MAG: response regulator [Verrucomicrobiia bacterium]
MPEKLKILLLDDDEDLLALYKGLLNNLPSKPEVYTTTNGARAVAMLDAEPFSLLITDLQMPQMDGFQVLTLVRRRFPNLKIVAITAVLDEQYRNRAYALGVDLCWQKPTSEQETKLFLECIEGLISYESDEGFRGIQSKNLVDLIQIECLCRNSTTLKVISGEIEGKIFILQGEIIDAEIGDLRGEIAFKKIISLKKGSFHYLPPEPDRERKIFSSYNGLLLDAAQTIDEVKATDKTDLPDASEVGDRTPLENPVTAISKTEGVEFVFESDETATQPQDFYGLDDPAAFHNWAVNTIKFWKDFGQNLAIGDLKEIIASGRQCKVVLRTKENKILCVGLSPTVTNEILPDLMKKIYSLWA